MTAPHPVPSGGGRHFCTSKISRRLPQAAAKSRAAPAVSSAISEEHIIPSKDGDGTQAPTEERRSVLLERTLRGARRRGLAAAAPATMASAGRDASSARPNWAAIAASPGNPTTNPPAGIKKSVTSGEWGASRQRLSLSLRRRIIVIWTHASLSIESDESRTGFIVGRDTQVVLGASLRAHVSLTSRHNTFIGGASVDQSPTHDARRHPGGFCNHTWVQVSFYRSYNREIPGRPSPTLGRHVIQ